MTGYPWQHWRAGKEPPAPPPLNLPAAHAALGQPADQSGGWIEYRVKGPRWEVRAWGESDWRTVQ